MRDINAARPDAYRGLQDPAVDLELEPAELA